MVINATQDESANVHGGRSPHGRECAASHHFRASVSVNGGSKYLHRDENTEYSDPEREPYKYVNMLAYHRANAVAQSSPQKAHCELDSSVRNVEDVGMQHHASNTRRSAFKGLTFTSSAKRSP